MTKKEKLAECFSSGQTAVPFSLVRSLLESEGFIMRTKGRTSGSRVAFEKPGTPYKIIFHKPHGIEVKRSTLRDIRLQLEQIRHRNTEDRNNA